MRVTLASHGSQSSAGTYGVLKAVFAAKGELGGMCLPDGALLDGSCDSRPTRGQ